MVAVVLLQWVNLWLLNQQQARHRVRNGKSAKIIDHSMQSDFFGFEDDSRAVEMEQRAAHAGSYLVEDLTDRANDEFVYIY